VILGLDIYNNIKIRTTIMLLPHGVLSSNTISRVFSHWRNSFSSQLIIIALFLVLPRAIVYILHFDPLLTQDSIVRYIPQLDSVKRSWRDILFCVSPGYTAFLWLASSINYNGKGIEAAILVQHLVSIACGGMMLLNSWSYSRYCKEFPTTYVAILLCFTTPELIKYEHAIMRDSLVFNIGALSFYLLHLANRRKPAEFLVFSSVWLLYIGILFRLETFVLMPLVYFFYLTHKPLSSYGIWLRAKLVFFNLLIQSSLFIIISFLKMEFLLNGHIDIEQPYGGSIFNVAFHYLDASNFEYTSDHYFELVRSYYEVASDGLSHGDMVSSFYQKTRAYLGDGSSDHDVLLIMDKVFLDQLFYNPIRFFVAYVNNIFHMALSDRESIGFSCQNTSSFFGHKIICQFSQKILSTVRYIEFYFTLAFFVFIFFRKHSIDERLAISMYIFYIIVISFIANSVARFVFPVLLQKFIAITYGSYHAFLLVRRCMRMT
jgi:hypothetical protein